jgi:glycosyltransferase involved in cell wall biosynthesis
LAEVAEDRSHNVKAFAKAIEKAANTPFDRGLISDAARQRYGWASLAAEILAAYRVLMRNSK